MIQRAWRQSWPFNLLSKNARREHVADANRIKDVIESLLDAGPKNEEEYKIIILLDFHFFFENIGIYISKYKAH